MTYLTDEIDEQQRKMVETMIACRPRAKTEKFDELVEQLGNPLMAELMWIYWGAGALKALDDEAKALNPHLRWWKFGQKRNTIRSLVREPAGKQWVWQMLNDFGAWF